MRWLVGLVVLLLAPTANAQEMVEITDAAGDVEYEGPGGRTDAPQIHESLDITRAWIGNENLTHFQVGLETAAERSTATPPEFTEIVDTWIEFSVGGKRQVVRFLDCGEDAATVEGHGCVPARREGARWVADVPKDAIRDADNFPVRPGSVLEAWFAASRDTVDGNTDAVDRGPDIGVGDSIVMQFGEQTFGDITLHAETPFRSSNGGPDTMVFPLSIANRGPAKDVLLTTTQAPGGWTVRLPGAAMVPAEDVIRVPVIVSTASAHAHGTTERFQVQVEPEDGMTATIDMGIHYLSVPQLAGHHPVVYTHAADAVPDVPCSGSDPGWFNTQVDDPDDTGMPIRNNGAGQNTTHGWVDWRLPLDPALLIGLDFDTKRQGMFEVTITPGVPSDAAFLRAELLHCPPQSAPETLAQGRSSSHPVEAGTPQHFEVPMEPRAYADLVPFEEGSNIALDLELAWTGPTTPLGIARQAEIDVNTGVMELPLNEYRDPIDEAFQDIGALRLQNEGSFEREGNAGQTVWYGFAVENQGERDRVLQLGAAGGASGLVHGRPEGTFRVASGDTASVAFALDIPEGASAGQAFEAFVLVEDADDPTVVALSKIRALVVAEPVEQPPAPDVATPQAKDSPGTPWVMLPAALALLVRRLR